MKKNFIEKEQKECWRLEQIELEEERQRLEKKRKKRIKRNIIVCVTAIGALCIYVWADLVFIPAEKYKKALDQISHGEYVKSYEQLISLDDYKDSKQKAKEIYDQYHVQRLENLPDVPVGDSILFGAYEQDNDTSDGKEKIEWIILKKEKDRAFLLSEEEAEECLPTSQEKQAEPTEYALAQGVSAVERTTDFDYGYCSWWLRSPGFLQKNANYVSESGVTSFYGAAVDNLDFGVRPAMWINITAS